jgi:hypothetical protein
MTERQAAVTGFRWLAPIVEYQRKFAPRVVVRVELGSGAGPFSGCGTGDRFSLRPSGRCEVRNLPVCRCRQTREHFPQISI